MWPFGSSGGVPKQTASDQDVRRLAKACKASLTAYEACHRIYKDDFSACERLENRITECMASRCATCSPAVQGFHECLADTWRVLGSTLGTECAEQVEDMRKCLRALDLYPIVE